MKGNSLFVIFLVSLTVMFSCQDRENIVVTGQVVDETTGNPIPNAEVVVLCWYMSNIEDASYSKQSLTTDKLGNYKAYFGKGYQVDVASKAIGYQPFRSYHELEDNEIDVTLKLAKQQKNSTVKTLLTTDQVMLDSEHEPTFLRVRVYAGKDGKTLDFRKVETFGIDLKTQSINSDTSQIDLWFKGISKEEQPTTLVTAQSGGIISILEREVNSSLLFEKSIAPTTGYKTIYHLTGEEAGFYVLCRDGKTYGKIILEKSLIDKGSPNGKGGYYKEFGRSFSYLYQPNGTTDLSYSEEDLDLENFLVDYRYR